MASYNRADWRARTALASLRATRNDLRASLTTSGSSLTRGAGRDLTGLPEASETTIRRSGPRRPMNSRSP